MGNPIVTVTNPVIVSRQEHLCAEAKMIIDKTPFPSAAPLVLPRGTLMGTLVSGGKARPYVEGTVKTSGAFATNSVNFTLDQSLRVGPLDFQVGDVIEDSAGNALGTIATYNASTGVGTLSGNSASALSAGGKVRVALSVLALAGAKGRVLKDQASVDSSADVPCVAYFSGYFVQANTTITAAALTALGGQQIDSAEARLI